MARGLVIHTSFDYSLFFFDITSNLNTIYNYWICNYIWLWSE